MFRYRLLAIVTIIGLILLNHWIFDVLFDADYLLWYINNGALIGAGVTFISLASKEFKKDVDAVSANPGIYFATYFKYLAIIYFDFGTYLRLNKGVISIFDSFIALAWMMIIIGATFLWILIVVPLQYFVFLLCGAPARIFHPAGYQVSDRIQDGSLEYRLIRESDEAEISNLVMTSDKLINLESVKKSLETPREWKVTSMSIEPVPLTNLLSILFFEAVKFIVL